MTKQTIQVRLDCCAEDFAQEIMSSQQYFKDKLLNNGNSSRADMLKCIHAYALASSYSNLVSTIVIFLTLDAVAIISIETEESKSLDIEKMTDQFAERKERLDRFKV